MLDLGADLRGKCRGPLFGRTLRLFIWCGQRWRDGEDFAPRSANVRWKEQISHEAELRFGDLESISRHEWAVRRNGGCRGPYVLFGKGFRAPPLRASNPMWTEAGKEDRAPLTELGLCFLLLQ
ncbi:hypothetical protein Nepgr_004285 [Nepenthes gracilis]|uniref:Uncharacterized protein n=1 Tax=Nepenthes gracilis TaxID=150966 RepID=A0AAD3XF52_NEPGR|nr:hypothetical protein Nepgr_004285 [Nepenthes gracilis]